ncbi:MAG: SpoIIIAH-like family protein [Ruminococcaceae bacterium]|nr:SpoIIIAH-like family protein [Oscillospiraceae bacterium]
MMMILKRKEVLIGSLIMLILVAAFINYNYSDVPMTELASTQNVSEQQGETSEAPDSQSAKKMGEAQYVSSNAAQIDISYFTQARLDKENARSKSKEMYEQIIANTNVDEESRKAAQQSLLNLAGASDKEAMCENLIKAKGFSECVVFINENSASVTVKSEKLSASDVAKIQEIVSSQTGILIKNIKIVEVK